MLELFRNSPVLGIHAVLIGGAVVVTAILRAFLKRSGASPRPAYWLGGLVLLVVVPQFGASLYGALAASESSRPRDAALDQLAPENPDDLRQSAAKLLLGPDADARSVTDAKAVFGNAMVEAESARFAVWTNGESVLLARFRGSLAAEKGWVAYLRETGLAQAGGTGDSQRGYVVSRPGGDRAYALHFGRMVGVWTGMDDAAIRRRMEAGGFRIPRRAPLGGATDRTIRSDSGKGLPTLWIVAMVAAHVGVVVVYFFKGAAWAGTVLPKPGILAVSAADLACRLESVNAMDVPFRVERGSGPGEWFATWRFADARWADLARARRLRRTFRVRMVLDERHRTVRATDFVATFEGSLGPGGATVEWRKELGIVFFRREEGRVYGLRWEESGRFVPEIGYGYRFDANELKSPLIAAVTGAGWMWRPTVWQAPAGLRWLTE